MTVRLKTHGIRAELIHSVDETNGVGLLDVLPASGTKWHAIRFLMNRLGVGSDRTIVAGDSGNDLDALTGGLKAVLVRNATDRVRAEAIRLAETRGERDRLYIAQGGFLGMNGNYAAGVLEGVVYFLPEIAAWLEPNPGAP
jgi:phosphoserine phosphatase